MLQSWEKMFAEDYVFGMHSQDVIQFRRSVVEGRESAGMFGNLILVLQIPLSGINSNLFYNVFYCSKKANLCLSALICFYILSTFLAAFPLYSRLSQGNARELTNDDTQFIERFVILLYDRSCQLPSIDECRRMLFTKKGRSIESLPPTKDALMQHTKRAVYQGG